MRLAEIVNILKTTELKQIVIGEDDNQIISLLNLALIDVYGRFNILQEEQLITLSAGKTRYNLQANTQRVLQVFAKHTNTIDGYSVDYDSQELPINDMNSPDSVFTPTPFILHVPRPTDGQVLSIMLCVEPPFVTESNIDTLEFIVPSALLESIVNYVAWRAYKSMSGSSDTEMSVHYSAYISSVTDAYKKGLVPQSVSTNLKSIGRGF
jgi:hypothetical protein